MKLNRSNLRMMIESIILEGTSNVMSALAKCNKLCAECPDANTFRKHLDACGLDITAEGKGPLNDAFEITHISSRETLVCDDNMGYDSMSYEDFDFCLDKFGNDVFHSL